jgi:hypothetical protein
MRMKKWLLLFIFVFSVYFSQAQTIKSEIMSDTIVNPYTISAGRMQLHLMIQREQKKADASDGVKDKLIDIEDDMDKTAIISNAVFAKVNKTIAYLENNETEDMIKRKYLGRIIDNLKLFNLDFNDGYVDVFYYKDIFEFTYQIIRNSHNKNLTTFVKANSNKALYSVSNIFEDDKSATTAMMTILSDQFPEVLIKKIKTMSSPEAVDIVVAKTAPKNPKLILNYATSTSLERELVRKNKDPYVLQIIRIADSTSKPLKAIFFVDELQNGKISLSELNKIIDNDDEYFKRMIVQRQAYFNTDLRKMYDRELVHEAARYVTTMNELHDQSDATRFRIVEKLSATELYYIMVYGSDDLYTSSFLGCYNRLLTRIKPKAGNEFLESLGKDKFRTFLRLCANYNTIASFLATMKPENKQALMRDFVNDLDKTSENDLEGATDVANSFASIGDTLLMKDIVQQILVNKNNTSVNTQSRGYRIYHILYTMLTESNDSITAKLGIPPITVMPFSQLQDDSGTVVQQVFFFGDKDGKGVFNSFIGGFGAPTWKVKRELNWVKISSIKGKRIDIYCNVPFDEPNDEFAQNALQDYLDENNIHPSIIIHRGHSYHLSGTLDHINGRHKVVILGACGAYQNLASVLSKSEDAQIVSTKQIGAGKINGPIIRMFNERLLAGKDIDWVEMWASLSKQFSGGETKQLFDDYVPPYKNLGALFLKAYRRSSNHEEL